MYVDQLGFLSSHCLQRQISFLSEEVGRELKCFTARKLIVSYSNEGNVCSIEVKKLHDHFGKGQAQKRGTLTKIRLADRGLNLERLGRYFKLFTGKVEVNGLEGLAEKLQKARERARK